MFASIFFFVSGDFLRSVEPAGVGTFHPPRSCGVVHARTPTRNRDVRDLKATLSEEALFLYYRAGCRVPVVFRNAIAAEEGLPIRFHFLVSFWLLSTVSFFFPSKHPSQVTPEVLVDIAGKIPQKVKDNLWSAIKSGSYHKTAVG